MIQVFLFNILFSFDMFVIFFFFINWVKYALNQVIHVGLLDRLINKQIHTYTVQALQSTVICHQNQNVHIQLHRRKTQLSVNQVSVYTQPKFFPLYHLFAGKIHIAHFQLY